MSPLITKNAKSIQSILEQADLVCEIVTFTNSTRTAQDAATSIGCIVSQIAKSIIFKTKDTLKPVLVMASGSNKINGKQIEFFVGEEIIKADAEYVREITGFAIGGIPPFGHKMMIDHIFIDQDLLSFDTVWAAAGTPNSVFCINTKQLVGITKGKVIFLTQW